MSGLFGYITDESEQPVAAVLAAMGAAIRHLAHQVVTTHPLTPSAGIGRLHIGIFNTEPQPVSSPDGQIQLFLTGEFYHQDQRRRTLARAGRLAPGASDAELALAVYQTDGAQGLTTLDGTFLIAVWDGRDQQLILVNDRFGLYPHYYSQTGAAFSFAPEIKGVLAAPGVGRTLNLTAVAEYVRFQQLLGDKTWLDEVELLPPASLLRYQPTSRRLTIECYWDWDQIGALPDISFEEAVEETARLLQRAVDARTASFHRYGIYLSGGMDGRTLLGFADDELPMKTVTYGDERCWDVVYAAELARRAGSDHHWFPFRDGQWVLDYAPLHLALTEGRHSWLHMHGITTLEPARHLIDVNLSGWNGGGVMISRLMQVVLSEARQDNQSELSEDVLREHLFRAFCRKITWPSVTTSELYQLVSDNQSRSLAYQSFRELFAQTAHYRPDRRGIYFYLQQHDLRSTINLVVFARAGIEVRCPFYDYALVDHTLALPDRVRFDPRFYGSVLYERAPELTAVPIDRTNRLPIPGNFNYYQQAAADRAKRGLLRRVPFVEPDRPWLYADYEMYLRTDLRDWADDLLFDARTCERGLFNLDAVRSFWERHLSGQELWTVGKIAPLIEIERVQRHLLDGDTERQQQSRLRPRYPVATSRAQAHPPNFHN